MDTSVAAGLLTLSGCVSGLSERRPGEELIGLTRAAAMAGIPSVIASLWSVDDESARIFFDHFYHFLNSGVEKDRALGATQQKLLVTEGLAHPVHWAPSFGIFVICSPSSVNETCYAAF